jgi:MFS family permease
MMPSSMALIGEAYPDAHRRTHAVAIWAMGGAVASSAAPLLGGVLTMLSWRAIFFINVPVGIVALLFLTKTPRSPARPAPLDWPGQITAVLAMAGLVFGVIQAGAWGITSTPVIGALLLAVLSTVAFLLVERRAAHPMVPASLVQLPSVRIASAIGFAFMIGYYGLPFVLSLYFQQIRGLSALATGFLFLPMFLIGFILTPFSARIAQRVGKAKLVTSGLLAMTAGLVLIALVVTAATPLWVVSALMLLIGLGGPLVMPMTTALLLEHVPTSRAGTASGIFNTSRQVGGALAVAVFGALLSGHDFIHGQRLALCLAGVVALLAAGVSLGLHARPRTQEQLTQKGVSHA